MSLPFSREDFFDVFARYNTAVWPSQLALSLLAGAALVFALRGNGRFVGWSLAILWAWMAVAYHFAFFSSINPLAWLFGGVFLIGAGIFARSANSLRFGPVRGAEAWAGFALIAYALIGYPMVGKLAGHIYPCVPSFGLPCPTTIFTLGLLLLARRPVPGAVFVVPLAWSAVGTSAAVELGVPQDFGLAAAALITIGALLLRSLGAKRRRPSAPSHPA